MLGLFFSFLWTLWELSTKSIFKITVLNNIPNKRHTKLQLSSDRHVGQLRGI